MGGELIIGMVAFAAVAAVLVVKFLDWLNKASNGGAEPKPVKHPGREKRLEVTKRETPLIDDETVGAIVRQAGRLSHDAYKAMFAKYGGTGEMKYDGQREHGSYCYNSTVQKATAIEIQKPTLQEDVGHWGKCTFYRIRDEGKEGDFYMAHFTKREHMVGSMMLHYSLEGFWIGAFPTLEEAVLAADYQWHYHKFMYLTFDEFAIDSGIGFIKTLKAKEQYYSDAGDYIKSHEYRDMAEQHGDYLRSMHHWSWSEFYRYIYEYPTEAEKQGEEFRDLIDDAIGEDVHGPMYPLAKTFAKHGVDVTLKDADATITFTGKTIGPDTED